MYGGQQQEFQVGESVTVDKFGQRFYAQVIQPYNPTKGYCLNIDLGQGHMQEEWVSDVSKVSRAAAQQQQQQQQQQLGPPPQGMGPGSAAAPSTQGSRMAGATPTQGGGDMAGRLQQLERRLNDAERARERLETNLQKEQVERDRMTRELELATGQLKPLQTTRAEAAAQLQEVTELSEEVRQSLRGLHEIGDYAGTVRDLESEVVDTRGAVESMMDMLEKTLTIKDGNALLDDQEARIDEKLHQSTEGLSALEEELGNVHSKMDTVAADLMKVAHEVSRHGEADALRLTEKIGGVESKLAEGMRSTEGSLATLEARMEKREAAMKRDLEAAKKDFSDELAKQNEAHAGDLARLMETMEQAQKKVADDLVREVQGAAHRADVTQRAAESQFARLDSLCTHLDEKITTSNDTLVQKLSITNKAVEDNERALGLRCGAVEKVVQELSATVQQCTADVKATDAGLVTKLAQEMQGFDDRFRVKVDEVEARALSDLQAYASDSQKRDVVVDQMLTTAQTNIASVEGGLAQIKEDVRHQVERTTEQLQKDVVSLQQQTDKVFADVKAGEQDVSTRLEDVIKQINGALQANTDSATAALADAAGSLSNRLDDQDRLLAQQHELDQGKVSEIARNIHEHQLKVDSALNGLEGQLRKTTADLAKSIDDEARKSDKASKTLADKTAKSLGEHDKRLDTQKRAADDSLAKVEKATEAKIRELDGKIADTRKYADELRRVGDQTITETGAALDKKLGQGLSETKRDSENLAVSVKQLSEEVLQLNQAAHALDDSTNNRFAEVGRECENLAVSLEKTAAEIDGQFSAVHGNVTELQRQMTAIGEDGQHRLADEISAVNARVEAVGAAVDDAHLRIADSTAGTNGRIEDVAAQISKMCSDLEQKMRGENAAQDDRSELVRQDINAHLEKLEQKFTELHENADEKVLGNERQLVVEITEVKKQIADASSVFDKRVSDAKLTVDANHKQLSDACASTEKKLATATREAAGRSDVLDKEVKANHKQLTGRCESLEKAIAAESASAKARSDDVATSSTAARSRLQEMLTTSTNEHHQKLLDLSTAMAQSASEAKAQIAKEEKQLEATATRLEKRTETLAGVVEANLNTALTAATNLDTKFSAEAERRNAQLGDLANATHRNQVEGVEGLKRLEDALEQAKQEAEAKEQRSVASMAASLTGIRSEFASKVDTLSRTIAAEKAHFAELVAQNEQKLDSRSASLEGTQTLMSKTIRANEDLIRELTTQIDGRVSATGTSSSCISPLPSSLFVGGPLNAVICVRPALVHFFWTFLVECVCPSPAPPAGHV